jgi:N-acetylglutamate synthase/N-acetylornithine aminotransferase
VKTALFGMDANWGRILCATYRPFNLKKLNGSGYAGVSIKPNTTSVSFIPRGEMDGEAKLKLLVNACPPNTTLMLG